MQLLKHVRLSTHTVMQLLMLVLLMVTDHLFLPLPVLQTGWLLLTHQTLLQLPASHQEI